MSTTSPPEGAFPHGVASGDPTPTSVTLWTSLQGVTDASVRWSAVPVHGGGSAASGSADVPDDGIVHVRVDGLEPGTRYRYRFELGDGEPSVDGLTRTLSDDGSRLRVAVTCCARWTRSSFQYRTDPHLQRLHAAAPWVAIWDDHEVANDAYRHNSPAHEGDDESYRRRREVALDAFTRWMPQRPESNGPTAGDRIAEITTPSVSAPPFAELIRNKAHVPAQLLRWWLRLLNPHIEAMDLERHGATIVDVTPDGVAVTDVVRPDPPSW